MKKNTSKQKKEPIQVSNLTTLEDLIIVAMGPPDKNKVDFKMVQAILIILAQQLRVLERPVDYQSLVEGEKSERESKISKRASEESEKAREKSERSSERSGSRSEYSEMETDRAKSLSSIEKADKTKEGKDQPANEKSFISVTEKDKVLVVEKLPTSRRGSGASQYRVGSIPVVTLSQFKILEAAVRALEEKAAPVPLPSMPDNRTLRKELVEGSASLTDTMQAMQVTARVQAAEEAIKKMADILTDMAAKDSKGKVAVGAAEQATAKGLPQLPLMLKSPVEPIDQNNAAMSVFSIPGQIFVTHPEMINELRILKDSLMKSIFKESTQAQKIAEQSLRTVGNADEKLKTVTDMDTRIQYLMELVNILSEQSTESEAAVTSLLEAFNGQLMQAKTDLHSCLLQFEAWSGDSETQAVKELHSRYDELVEVLDGTLHSHEGLAAGQNQLEREMQDILTRVEMLQDEKSDRDEMLDRLRDKADICAMKGLLPAKEFFKHKERLEDSLERCQGRFERQDAVWHMAIQDLEDITNAKSELHELLKLKEETEGQLNVINEKLRRLTFALGEPKAALLARQLSIGGHCGSCHNPAIQEVTEKSYGRPPRLPSAYFTDKGAGDPCDVETNPPIVDEKTHICNRWAGGSHTLISGVKYVQGEPLQSLGPPTEKYTDYGDDGMLYKMEKKLDPCQHCEPQCDEDLVNGAGDTVIGHSLREPQNTEK